MKILLFLYLAISFVYSKEVICVVPKNIKSKILPLFSTTIAYSQMKVTVTSTPHENTLTMLSQSEDIKFAIVRRDILWQIQQTKAEKQIKSYITIGTLPNRAQLFLLQRSEALDIDIDMLVGQKISVGALEDKNSYYLKALLKFYGYAHSVYYKSNTFKRSMIDLKEGSIGGYFTFLPKNMHIDDVHSQTLFSKEVIQYFEDFGIFEIDYYGIYSPYVLVASMDTNDEEIENIIYRLMENEIFNPVTDIRFGTINQYVLTHLESVKTALAKNKMPTQRNKVCRKYHYGFLKLLREKPKLKKQLKQIYSLAEQKKYMNKINTILIEIDKHKEACDLNFLKSNKEQFLRLKKKIKESF